MRKSREESDKIKNLILRTVREIDEQKSKYEQRKMDGSLPTHAIRPDDFTATELKKILEKTLEKEQFWLEWAEGLYLYWSSSGSSDSLDPLYPSSAGVHVCFHRLNKVFCLITLISILSGGLGSKGIFCGAKLVEFWHFWSLDVNVYF